LAGNLSNGSSNQGAAEIEPIAISAGTAGSK